LRKVGPDQLLGKVGGIGGDEVDTGDRIDVGEVFLGVHPFVENQGELAFAADGALHGDHELLQDLGKDLGIMAIPLNLLVEKGNLAALGNQQRHPHLPRWANSESVWLAI